jgi:spermidine synthase
MRKGADPSGSAEPDLADSHVEPFVFDSRGARALHFSIHEIQSRMRLADPDALDLEYTRTMMGFLLFRPDPLDIGMVGLGGGSLVKFCHRYLAPARISVVEINPHVIRLRDEFRVPPDGARLSVLLGDGAMFVRRLPAAFDVLMIDGFDSQGMSGRLATQRFYDDCRRALRPGGLLVVNLHRLDPRLTLMIDRVRRTFSDAVLVVNDAEVRNTIVFARHGRGFDDDRPGLLRHPEGLDGPAMLELLEAFTPIIAALPAPRSQCQPHRP